MDIIRKETDYAVRCLIRLAGLVPGSIESVKQIATEAALPEPLLRKILQRLVKGGIVVSVKGRNGGVHLARGPHQITLHDIIEAVQGQVVVSRCTLPGACCDNMPGCRLHECIGQIQTKIESVLKETTVADLLGEVGRDRNGTR
jgi:Rrf2 family protein